MTDQSPSQAAALTPEVREDLKAKALKATPGPWMEIETESSIDYVVDHLDGRAVINAWSDIGTENGEPPIAIVPQIYDSRDGTVTAMDDNIAFMLAANPSVVLRLLTALEEAEGRATGFDPMRVARQIHAQQHGPSVWATLTDAGRDMYRDRLLRAIRDAELDAQQEAFDAALSPSKSEADNGQ